MTATDHAIELVAVAARAASDKLADQIIAFDVSEQLAITDAFVLASATNDRQVKAIVDEIEDKLREIGAKPIRREGERDGRWVLLDYGEIVVHVQHEEERDVLRPRAALERLPVDPARHADVSLRRTPRPAAARPDRLERRRPGPGPADIELDDIGHAQAEAAALVLAALGPGADLVLRPVARPPDRGDVAEGDRPRPPTSSRALREYDVGERTGLTLDEFAAAFPDEFAAWLAGDESLDRAGRRDRRPTCGPASCRPCARASTPSARGDRRRGDARRRPARRRRRAARLAGRARRDPGRDGQLRLAAAARAHALRPPPAGVVQPGRATRERPRPRGRRHHEPPAGAGDGRRGDRARHPHRRWVWTP